MIVENDQLGADTDFHYTHGGEISYVSDTYIPRWIRTTALWLPFTAANSDARFSWTLGQKIYTPDDLNTEALIADDRPYAGWLFLGLGLVMEQSSANHKTTSSLDLLIGTIGPNSGTENVQTAMHKWIGVTKPRGWDNQLHDEYTLDLRYRRSWSFPLIGNHADLLPNASFIIGTSQRGLSAGLTLRVGTGLTSDYGPPLIRPGATGSYYFKPQQSPYWYLFAGAQTYWVHHNVFLNGNRDGDSHSVPLRNTVGDFQGGLVVGADNWRLSLTVISRDREFHGQPAPDQFGSFSIAFRF